MGIDISDITPTNVEAFVQSLRRDQLLELTLTHWESAEDTLRKWEDLVDSFGADDNWTRIQEYVYQREVRSALFWTDIIDTKATW